VTWFDRLEERLLAALLAAMTLLTVVQVIARYVFNYSFVWALELVTVLFAWLIFLGMSYGVRVGAHIGVDALVKALSPRAARVTAIVAATLCVVYGAIVTTGASIYLEKMYAIGIDMQDLPLPQWVPRLVLPLGFALLTLRFAGALIALWRGADVRLVGDEAEQLL
jgi:C4-dicarboxylate transporter DctQ subunit